MIDLFVGFDASVHQSVASGPPEMCSGAEAGSYLRLIDFVYHSPLGLRVIKKKRLAHLGDGWVVEADFRVRRTVLPQGLHRQIIFMGFMTSDRNLKASREGAK